MTRRMKANTRTFVAAHTVEHDEIEGCAKGIPCEPVADTVTVPATGTFVVVDGAVRTGTRITYTGNEGGRNRFIAEYSVDPPKPTFFEAGKKYRWKGGHTFEVARIDTDSGGDPVAYGLWTYTNGDTDWTIKRSFLPGWEEV